MSNDVINVDVFALSNCGYAKEDNEDSMYVSEDKSVIAVADGMGGEPYGEVASALAVQAVEELWRAERPCELGEEDHPEWMERAFDFANEKIYRYVERDSTKYGMGTTMVAAVVAGGGATVGNIGDSRAILIEGKYARTITRDHVAGEGKRRGLIRRIGGDFSITTDIFTVSVSAGAWLLLCTDGLHGVVPLDEVVDLSRSCETSEEFCEALIEAALEGGGPDNITVIALRTR